LKLSTDDYIAINQLYAKYAFAIDLHDLDGWLATWAEDGEYVGYDGRRAAKGHDALRAMGEAVVALPEEKGFHWNANIMIEPADYGASGKCYLMHVRAFDGGRGEIHLALYYRDELVNDDGKWLFRRRQTNVL
jgi:hypothetical protein